MHVATINEKRGHEFERKQGWVYGLEGGRGNDVNYIMLPPKKEKKKSLTE